MHSPFLKKITTFLDNGSSMVVVGLLDYVKGDFMKTLGKIMKWLGIGIGALLVIIVLALLIMNVIFSRELRQTLARLKAELAAQSGNAGQTGSGIPGCRSARSLYRESADLPESRGWIRPLQSGTRSAGRQRYAQAIRTESGGQSLLRHRLEMRAITSGQAR